jgi:hypothetical protein
MHAHVETPRSLRLVFWLRVGRRWVSDPFSFHSLNGTGRNQNRATAETDITVLSLETLDALQERNDSLNEALGKAFQGAAYLRFFDALLRLLTCEEPREEEVMKAQILTTDIERSSIRPT